VTTQHISSEPRPGKHVLALDGLRGIAIIFVMLFHYINSSNFAAGSQLTRRISSVAACMWTGVDLFFVLSGFLITGILLRAKDEPSYFTNFYMRRVLRIFPLYYGALVLIFLIVPHFVPVVTPAVKRVYDSQGWLWAYAEDVVIMVRNQDYFDVDWLWIGQFWSLAVEEHFYLVWPLLVFLCGRRALIATTLGLMLVTPLLRAAMLAHHIDPAAIYTSTLSRSDELACGGLVAILAEKRSYESMAKLARWGALASCSYLFSVILVRRKPLYWEHWTSLGLGFSALALGFAALIVFALAPRRNLLRRVLENRVLRGFGKYSYGAYVIHTPLQPVYLRLFPPERIGLAARGLGYTASRLVGLLGFAALGIAVTMVLAFVSFSVYEKPFLKLKRYFEYEEPVRAGTV
jgi:peptidoglycan/LPS O-acetylase OafA/YrhL